MVTVVVMILLITVAAVISIVMVAGRRPAHVESRHEDFEDGVVSEPVPIPSTASAPIANSYRADDLVVVRRDEIEAEVPAADEPEVRWTKQFEPRSGALSDEARLRLINDLGMLGAPWCIPLLTRACEQETDPAYRVAAQLALARCREGEAVH